MSVFDKSILGHTEIRRRLLDRLNSNKLSGSLLFVGPEGVGKRRVALELAQRETCYEHTACGICEGCNLFKTDPLPKVLPNLLRIAPEGKAGLIKIDVIREDDLVEGGVINWAYQAAPPGCHKWIIIEDAHRLNKASANILLKILEEPPAGSHFILLTHRPDSALPTIRSRAERVAFGLLSAAEIGEIALARGWESSKLPEWTAISNGTLKYLDADVFSRACSQIDAWVSIMEGASLKDVSESLLPDKYKHSDVADSQQTALALEQLLLTLDELIRIREGLPTSLAPWAARLSELAGRRIDLRNGYRCALEALRSVGRNVAPEAILRKISLFLAPSS
jgi:DNA polymerase-3 subunit delta'